MLRMRYIQKIERHVVSSPSNYGSLQDVIVEVLDGGGALEIVHKPYTKVRCKDEH